MIGLYVSICSRLYLNSICVAHKKRRRETTQVQSNFSLQVNVCIITEIYYHVFFSFFLPIIYCMRKTKLFTSVSYFSKTVSPWCFWFRLTVTECRSRWIIPSIQTAAIVILKEQTYVGERNVDYFKGMMKAQCWIVQKEAPMSE